MIIFVDGNNFELKKYKPFVGLIIVISGLNERRKALF